MGLSQCLDGTSCGKFAESKNLVPPRRHSLAQRCGQVQYPRRTSARRWSPVIAVASVTSDASATTVQQQQPEMQQPHHISEATEKHAGVFDWTKQWYPLAVADQLDPSRPNKASLLGQQLAVWRDPEGVWRAFEDRCPHRLAPFTEGRVEEADGMLSCSYHGWRFDGSGRVQEIPQAAGDPAVHAAALQSSRACVASFPTTVQENTLWVWGESGAEAFIHSAAKRPAVTVELDALPAGAPVFHIGKPYCRDIYYDFETLVENFLDPAHVPFAHHGVLGDRYKTTAGSVQITRSKEVTVPNGGFSFDTTFTMGASTFTTKVQFQPPGLVRYFTPRDNGSFSVMNLHCVPLGPNRSRVIHSVMGTVDNKFMRIGSKIPAWKDHFKRHLVFDGDHALLHIQEQIAAREARQPGGSWRKSYWMPTHTDRIVTAWRQWVDTNGGPTWAVGTPTPPAGECLPKAVLLDRWDQHTKDCPYCLGALRNFKALRAAAAGLSAVSALVALVAVVVQALPQAAPAGTVGLVVPAGGLVVPAVCVGVAVAAAVAWRKLSDTVEKFYWVDYDHQAKS